MLTSLKCKYFYNEYIEFNLEPASAMSKWRTEYSLDENICYQSLPLAKQCTKEPKLLAVQFKLTHNIINCRSNKRKWNISDSDTCEFCSPSILDDIVHAYYQFEYSTEFVTDIFSLNNVQNDNANTIHIADFLFGVDGSSFKCYIFDFKEILL